MNRSNMQAAVFAGPGRLELQSRPIPRIQKPDQVLLEVEGCGICGTDLHILEVPPGHPATPGSILGHEFLGRVLQVGPEVAFLRPGQRVAVAPNLSCGRCLPCRAGRLNHCQQFTTLGIFQDGGLAPFCLVPERACHPLSPSLPFEEAVWTEVLSCVIHSVDRLQPRAGEKALVLGAGPTGALHALLFAAAGVHVFIADVKDSRLKLLSRLGVARTLHSGRESLSDLLRGEVPGGFHVVVDCVGDQLKNGVELAAVGGRISLFGMNSEALPAVPQNAITRKELTLYGSFVGTHTFPRAIEILEQGIIRPSSLITRNVSLEGLPEALEALRRGEEMKIVVHPREI